MAAAADGANNPDGRRNRVVLDLPDDFLRPDSVVQQEMADRELAAQLQNEQHYRQHTGRHYAAGYAGQLIITLVEATLVKNYGMTKMDPYVRLRVGHSIYETHACPAGGRTPRWNKQVQCYLPVGVDTVSVEIYDECTLTVDELVAYGLIQIPQAVFQNESVDAWFQLSGKQGENREGSIHVIMTLLPVTQYVAPGVVGLTMAPAYRTYPAGGIVTMGQAPMMVVPTTYGVPAYAPMTVYNTAAPNPPVPQVAPVQHANPPAPRALSETEIHEIQSMFPSLDHQVIQSVIEACGGRREAIIDSLLELSNQ